MRVIHIIMQMWHWNINLTLNTTDSIRTAASIIAHNMLTYYTGNLTGNEPGLLPQPYYWSEAGAMWGGMVEYWHYTGDTSYNDVVAQAILAQVGPKNDFLMPEQVLDTVGSLSANRLLKTRGKICADVVLCVWNRATTIRPSGLSQPSQRLSAPSLSPPTHPHLHHHRPGSN